MGSTQRAFAAKLRSIALSQSGYFTAGQASQAGYADSIHGYHVGNGDWVKEYRGIYRLADLERPAWGDLVVMSLWSRGRDGEPRGVFSGETALGVWGLIDLDTEVLHMTVPTNFRKNCDIPPKLRLHWEDLFPRDVERRDGFLVTSVEKAIQDVKAACTNPKIFEALRKAGNLVGLGDVRNTGSFRTAEGTGTSGGTKGGQFDDWDEAWTGRVQPCGWGAGMSFEDALLSGQD